MQEKLITVEIDENGNSSIDLEGFRGQGCGDVTKDFRGWLVLPSVESFLLAT